MKLTFTLLAAAAGMCLGAGAAQAQDIEMPGQPGASSGPANPAASARDTSEMDIMRDRDEAILREDRQGRKKGKGPVPATPDQVILGSEVHDLAGLKIGTVASIGGNAAVVTSPGGSVEIPLEAFGTDGKRLMIAMPKADFDAAVAAIAAGG